MNVFLVPINYLAVLACGVGAMIIGAIWYGPLFGKEWKKFSKTTATPKTYGLMFLSSLVMAYVLAHFVWYAAPGSLTLLITIKTAVWAWLGFVVTIGFTKHLFTPDKKPIKLFILEMGYYLVVLVHMSIILYFFR